jgi:hypothetical protein
MIRRNACGVFLLPRPPRSGTCSGASGGSFPARMKGRARPPVPAVSICRTATGSGGFTLDAGSLSSYRRDPEFRPSWLTKPLRAPFILAKTPGVWGQSPRARGRAAPGNRGLEAARYPLRSWKNARGAPRPRLPDAAVDLRGPMGLGMVEDPRAMGHAARFRVGSAVVEPREPRRRDRSSAGRAGLQRDPEIAPREPCGPQRLAGRADRQHLGMGRGVGQFPHPVAGARDHLARPARSRRRPAPRPARPPPALRPAPVSINPRKSLMVLLLSLFAALSNR